MNTLMFFYTLAILVICIVTAVLSLAAYASSRRRFFIYGSGVFICYAIEMTEIFFFEYTLQNQSFPASDYYSITMPVMRTLVATASQAFIWLIAMDLLDKHSKKQFAIPVLTFLLCESLIIVAVPSGPMHQWLYYTMRQVFLVFVGLYIFWTAHKSTQVELKARVNKQRKHLIIGAILVGCIVAEDFYNILVVPMSLAPSWLQLYLSERNFSENIFACYFAILLIIYSYHVLSIRMQEAPEKKTSAILIDTSKSRCPSIATPISSPIARPRLCAWSYWANRTKRSLTSCSLPWAPSRPTSTTSWSKPNSKTAPRSSCIFGSAEVTRFCQTA